MTLTTVLRYESYAEGDGHRARPAGNAGVGDGIEDLPGAAAGGDRVERPSVGLTAILPPQVDELMKLMSGTAPDVAVSVTVEYAVGGATS